jgi:hypothetical protein
MEKAPRDHPSPHPEIDARLEEMEGHRKRRLVIGWELSEINPDPS